MSSFAALRNVIHMDDFSRLRLSSELAGRAAKGDILSYGLLFRFRIRIVSSSPNSNPNCTRALTVQVVREVSAVAVLKVNERETGIRLRHILMDGTS